MAEDVTLQAPQKGLDLTRSNNNLFLIWRGNPGKTSEAKCLGNAFAVAAYVCLTAKHVVEDENCDDLYLAAGDRHSAQKVLELVSHPSRDVALLKIDPGAASFKQPYLFSPLSLDDYQQSQDTLYSCGRVQAAETAQHFAVRVSQYNAATSVYGLQGNIKHGKSGGCILNSEQQVVGVVFANSDTQKNHYAIAVNSFRAWLFEQGVIDQETQILSPLQQQCWQVLQSQGQLESEKIKPLQLESVKDCIAYALKNYARRCQQQQLDEGFVNLELLADCGAENQEGRFQKQGEFQNLLQLLQAQQEMAFALVGRPGNGKTVLLKQLELQLCKALLTEPKQSQTLPFYIELNQYPPNKQADISPLEWLNQQWQLNYPQLDSLLQVMSQRPVLFLLDALNEMKISSEAFEEKIRQWRCFLRQLQQHFPTARAIFTCRAADYSGVLSDERENPVPQIYFKDLSEVKIREFFVKHLGKEGKKLADDILAIAGLELNTPFYLELAVRFYKEARRAPRGASELIAGMLWFSLQSEYKKEPPSPLLTQFVNSPRTQKKLAKPELWINKLHKLPNQEVLIQALIELAWSMQKNAGGEQEVSLDEEDIFEVFLGFCNNSEAQADQLLSLVQQLDLLRPVTENVTWKFSHQLLQEYFAAQKLVQQSELYFLNKKWLIGEAQPDLQQSVNGLSVADPLPNRKTSGWEETTFHAVAISRNPRQFIQQVKQQDLVLASRCCRHPEINQQLSAKLKTELQQELLVLSQNANADLRARMEAGLELGYLGHPQFNVEQGKDAAYISPPPRW